MSCALRKPARPPDTSEQQLEIHFHNRAHRRVNRHIRRRRTDDDSGKQRIVPERGKSRRFRLLQEQRRIEFRQSGEWLLPQREQPCWRRILSQQPQYFFRPREQWLLPQREQSCRRRLLQGALSLTPSERCELDSPHNETDTSFQFPAERYAGSI